MTRLSLLVLVIAVFALHQDFWHWRVAHPLLFGVLPVGLWYHVVYTLVVSALMWLLVRLAWPAHLENSDGETRGLGDRERTRQKAKGKS
ncbi:MAG: DUF3311 domain-containing protein [Blastocatellia bacterium]